MADHGPPSREGIDSRIRTGANRYASVDLNVDDIARTATTEFGTEALREDQFDPGLEPAHRGGGDMTTERFSLDGQVAIVTGGGRGIGRAIVEGFAEAGAAVVPASRTREDVEAACEAVRERESEALAVTADVTDPADVESLVDRTVDEFGGVDVVVNNAGVNPNEALGPPEAVEPEGYDHTLDVNLGGAFRCATAAAETLHENGGGCVVNVASVGGLVGLPRQHPYVASKHGLVGMTKSMALDWAPDVRVNALAPGYVRTELTDDLQENEDLRRSVLDRTPLDRFADPEELAGPAIFLASDAASFVTGECLAADGGWTSQ